jgi:hypothetical protein
MTRKFNPSRRHAKTRSVTIRAAWIAGICTITAAIIGAVLAYELPSASSASSALPVTSVAATASAAGPDLKVEEVEIALADNIDALGKIPPDVVGSPYKDTGSAIDITLRNSGNAPALIVGAVLSFTRATQLYSCPPSGGALVSSADYDVKVPIAKPVSANNPLIVRRDMRFTVNANSIDRFRISVGPEQYSSFAWPWVYEFNLSLVEDNGQKLDLGPMSILGFSMTTGFSWDPLDSLTQTQLVITQQLPCVARDTAELSHAMANPGLHSPELQMMYQQAERLTANAPSCRQIPIAQNPNGCPAPGGKGAFFSDPRGVTICSDTVEVAGSTCGIADDVAKKYEEAKAPKVVSMTFKPRGLVIELRMQCLPAGHAEVCREAGPGGLVVGFIP